MRDHEYAAEWEYRTARPGRIGKAHPLPVISQGLGRLLIVQPGQHRTQGRALHPLDHQVLTSQNMQVGGLPGVTWAPAPGSRSHLY